MTLPSLGLLPVPPAPVPAILDVRLVGPTSTISGDFPRRINITGENNSHETTPPLLPGSLRQDTPRTTTSSTTGGFNTTATNTHILGPRTATSMANDDGRPLETPWSVDQGGRGVGEDRRYVRFSLEDYNPTRLGTESTTAGPSTATAATVLGPLNGQDLQWAPSSSQQPLSGFRRVASVLRPTPPSATLDASLLLAMKCRPRPGSFFHQESMRYLGNRQRWLYIRTPSLWGPHFTLVIRAGHPQTCNCRHFWAPQA